ncbi:hypothetical protein BT63DRAFT_389525 [Microthyrium microscopicum]|uniref:Snf7-domain-containing protein n=1 Tax=Microthyrium microscopicum TaxID=703497 RepID=A0A6A6U9F0_9PEZI|nr:hypothetical protein BT63DRAFT_389525 [Microthyrium microscopicum]
MQQVRSFFFGPTPQEQKQKCNALIRKNTRLLDRDIANLKQTEFKTRNLIIQASKRAQRNPSQKTQAIKETKLFARELIKVRKQNNRLHTSKAQLESVKMQVNEAFAVRKIEGSIRTSTGIMKEVNSLVRLPELMGTMRELSQELVKAGIVEEMVGDMLPGDELMEDDYDETEEEVEKVLGEILKDKTPQVAQEEHDLPSAPVAVEEDVEQEESMADMRNRLEALRG